MFTNLELGIWNYESSVANSKFRIPNSELLRGSRPDAGASVLFLLDHRRRRPDRRGHAGFDVASEDHLPRRRLQHAGDDDVDRLADHLARVVHHHHRAIVEIGDALVVLLAFLEDENQGVAYLDDGTMVVV